MEKQPEQTSKKLSREAWSAHYEAWSMSGESQSSYCKRHDLKYATFCYWRTQLKCHSAQAKSNFETLDVKSTPQVLPGIRIHLPNGIQLSMPLSPDLSTLRSVLELLGVVSC
ncbi:MAG: hypothetical protein COV35_07040 [Alphaproteobacteria bacterium CG11_big_fil_rev_8_21_14_0_20_39_49]|nr:MAG: hypothetical protein COV35_07040 [Alphaproteobacteria bacterium CG11_big_fil_rev_8_21_14_0_20_39_49]